jgi:hypothetical protein
MVFLIAKIDYTTINIELVTMVAWEGKRKNIVGFNMAFVVIL